MHSNSGLDFFGLELPLFMPDATRAAVKSLTAKQLKEIGVRMIVSNTYHLMIKPGADIVEKAGGLHKFMGWDGPILTDSGGFQVFSLIHRKKLGKITDKGAIFKSPYDGKTHELTPEKSIDIQIKLGSDVLVALDEPIAISASFTEAQKSVERTTNWAMRAKEYFSKLPRKVTKGKKLFCVFQGGIYKDLRSKSLSKLLEIGFDGYGFGGWPVNEKNELYEEILKFTADMIPGNKIKYAMGVGHPDDIVRCFKMGWNLFDCVLPTRNARHGFLYVTEGNHGQEKNNYEILRFSNGNLVEDFTPIDKNCDCYTCQNFTRSYLSQLFRTKEPLFATLSTIHNLRFYENLTRGLGDKRKFK